MDAPPIRALVDVVDEHVRKRGKRELRDQVLGWVEDALEAVPEFRVAYEFRNRGKTKRRQEVRDLQKLARAWKRDGGQPTDEVRKWLTPLFKEVGMLALDELGAQGWCALTEELVSRLEKIDGRKFRIGWRPYLYGVLLPEIAYRDLCREPNFYKDEFGFPRGLLLDFVRSCLKELKEDDVDPQTIAKAIKQSRIGGKAPHNGREFFWDKHPWSFDDPFLNSPGEG